MFKVNLDYFDWYLVSTYIILKKCLIFLLGINVLNKCLTNYYNICGIILRVSAKDQNYLNVTNLVQKGFCLTQ